MGLIYLARSDTASILLYSLNYDHLPLKFHPTAYIFTSLTNKALINMTMYAGQTVIAT